MSPFLSSISSISIKVNVCNCWSVSCSSENKRNKLEKSVNGRTQWPLTAEILNKKLAQKIKIN